MLGVAYMHKQGVVHRDLKLDNILLDSHGNVKIGDFGVSRRIQLDQTLYEQCGTPTYIAPEVMDENGYRGFKVDIWSAGICLYGMLHGHVPLTAYQLDDLTPEFYQQEIEYCDEELTSSVIDLIKSMLQIDVKKRPTAEEVLQHAWFDGVDNCLNIFDEQEKNFMKKEFTYVMRKSLLQEQKNRSQSDLNTEFTEHSIGAVSA